MSKGPVAQQKARSFAHTGVTNKKKSNTQYCHMNNSDTYSYMADGCEGSQGPTSLKCCGQSECISPSKNGKSVNVSTIPAMVTRLPCNTSEMRSRGMNG